MTLDKIDILSTIGTYYNQYGIRARELSKEGKKIIGYLCGLTPVEIIHAAGLVPLRIKGNVHEPITKADTQMETIVCPLVRSCYDISLKGYYDFLSGLVIPHACDSISRTYDIWRFTLGLPYSHMVNMPHSTDDSSLEFFKNILDTFRLSIGKFAGKEISDSDLRNSIKVYNNYREKLKKISDLRKQTQPPITGTEMNRLLVATMGIPVEEANTLLDETLKELKKRQAPSPKKARLMIIGSQVDDDAFINLVEESGATVVIDDLCPGTREYYTTVSEKGAPVEGLAEHYLREIKCGRTYRQQKGDYESYLEDRFGHDGRFIKEYGVDGVIVYIYKYCDSFGFEVPALKSYIQSKGVPVLYLEDEYSMASMARLKTRIQAFLEMLDVD